MIQIIPTLLVNNKKTAREKLIKYKNFFNWLQLDIIDGIFVDNKTLTLKDFQTIKESKDYQLDIHLMVKNPLGYLEDCQKINSQRIIGQIEMMPDQQTFVQKALTKTCQVGLAVDLATPIEKINQVVLKDLDVILVMSVKAGWGGQSFHPEVLEKVKKLAKFKKQNGFSYKIALDGGINLDNISSIARAGAEIVYVGSAIQNNPKETLKQLKLKCQIQI